MSERDVKPPAFRKEDGRRTNEREARLAALRRALEDGERSGDAVPFDIEAFLIHCAKGRGGR